jgi:hypothetical protein
MVAMVGCTSGVDVGVSVVGAPKVAVDAGSSSDP